MLKFIFLNINIFFRKFFISLNKDIAGLPLNLGEPPIIRTQEEHTTKQSETPVERVKIKKNLLPKSQIMGKRKYPIKQIVLHFTEGSNFQGTYDHWVGNKERIGTHYCVDKDGTIYQTIEDENWAYSLGINYSTNDINKKYKTSSYAAKIEQLGIGIEMISEGALILKNNKYYFTGGQRYISSKDVITLEKPFRGSKYFTKFTEEQIKSVVALIKHLKEKHNLTFKYTEDIYHINKNALDGVEGLYSHVCYRYPDKQDIFYYKPLDDLLKTI